MSSSLPQLTQRGFFPTMPRGPTFRASAALTGTRGMASASSAPAAAEEPEEQVDVETKLADARRLQSAGSTDEAIEAFATVLEMRIEAHGEHDV
eukprot:4845530-Prymnesium_polylepis.1